MVTVSSYVIEQLRNVLPGAFMDARLLLYPENAVLYRTRQPLVADTLVSMPLLTDCGAFGVSYIMSGRTQVGICIAFPEGASARIVAGDHAAFRMTSGVAGRTPIGEALVAVKTQDFVLMGYQTRNALLLKKVTR